MQLGKYQKLEIIKKVEFGVYLAESRGEEERVLLPKAQVPVNAVIGDRIEVFLYRDSKDRMIATTARPKLTLGGLAALRVSQVGKIGAFLDWGLEKDLFLPFKEQKKRVKPGEEVLVSLYLDKSNRLCATMNVYHELRTDSSYKKDDEVTGRVYEISERFGAFVAVDDQFSALIPKKELYGKLEIGQMIDARVTEVKEDGKLSLSIRKKAYLQIDEDAEKLREILASYENVLPFNDKVSPEIIRRETGMSKNEFKRAVGHLLKLGEIEIGEKVIRKIK